MEKWNEKSKTAWDNSWSKGNIGESVGAIVGGATGILQSSVGMASIADTSMKQSAIDDLESTQFNHDSYDTLMSSYNPFSFAKTNYTASDVRGKSNGQLATGVISSVASGAASGATIGGPWGAIAGAAVGLGSGLAGLFIGNAKARKEAERLNEEGRNANEIFMANFSNNASNISNSMFNNAALNIAAEGGQLDTYDQSKVHAKNFKMKHRKSKYKGFGNYFAYGGQLMSGDWSNGVVIINEGDTHEKNPMGGVLMGIDAQGIPNLVEEGEVIFNDYVYSNRLKPTEKQLEEMHLDTKMEGDTYAEIAKKIQDESSIRPLDNISKNTLIDGLSKLTIMQEETRMKKERQKLLRAIRNMSLQEPIGELPIEEGSQESYPQEMGGAPINAQQEIPTEEHTPRAYRGIREEMPEMYAYGGYSGNIYDGEGDKPNILEGYPKSNLLQFMPVIGSGIAAVNSLFEKPDYTNADLIARGRRNIRDISASPIGGYMSFDPYDINYEQNKMQNANLGTQRNMLGLASGNRGAALANLAAYDITASNKASNLRRQSMDYNNQQKFRVGEFNSRIKQFDAQQTLEANRTNQSADAQRASLLREEADLRYKIDNQLSESASSNISGFLSNLGEAGKDIYTAAQERFLLEHGYFPKKEGKCGGRIKRRVRKR